MLFALPELNHTSGAFPYSLLPLLHPLVLLFVPQFDPFATLLFLYCSLEKRWYKTCYLHCQSYSKLQLLSRDPKTDPHLCSFGYSISTANFQGYSPRGLSYSDRQATATDRLVATATATPSPLDEHVVCISIDALWITMKGCGSSSEFLCSVV